MGGKGKIQLFCFHHPCNKETREGEDHPIIFLGTEKRKREMDSDKKEREKQSNRWEEREKRMINIVGLIYFFLELLFILKVYSNPSAYQTHDWTIFSPIQCCTKHGKHYN